MLPFAKGAFGVSSFLGVLYYATFCNKTETPGLTKWFGGQHPVGGGPALSPFDRELDRDKASHQHEDGEGKYEVFFVEDVPVVEEKPFIAPLELVVIERESVERIYQGDWVLIGYTNPYRHWV